MRTTQPVKTSIEAPAPFAIAEAPYRDAVVVLDVRGELDIATTPQLREHLAAVIRRGPELVIVDLALVDFLDSVTLAVLLRAEQTLTGKTKMAVVVAPGTYARLIFDVTGVDRCLHVVASREQALEPRQS